MGHLTSRDAYSELYIEYAQQVFAHMLHYVIYDLGMEYDPYCRLFVQSGVADQFRMGNSRYVAGMSETELLLRLEEIPPHQ